MKKISFIILFVYVLFSQNIQAQEEVKNSKLSIMGYAQFGNGSVINDSQPNYNIYCYSGELLLNYKLSQSNGLASGIGIYNYSGNGFNSIGNFNHQRRLLKIPLYFTFYPNVADYVKVIFNLGVYGQTIITDQYYFQKKIETGNYSGWNFGSQIGLGFAVQLLETTFIGINLNTQSDFNSLETNDNTIMRNNQKIKFLNSVGLFLSIEL